MKKIASLFLGLSSLYAAAQTPISQARSQALGSIVTVSGIVTNGDELGPIRYIQDATGAIPAYPGSGSVTFSCSRGDSITITGALKDYNGLLEIDPISAYTVHTSNNPLPTPLVVSATQLNESIEGQLVQLNQITFSAGGSTFSSGTYNFTDGSGNQGVIYVRSAHPLIGSLIPLGPIDLVGIMSQFTFTGVGGYQVLPRDANDIIQAAGILFASGVDQSNISTAGFDLSFATNLPGTAHVKYGETAGLELGEFSSASSATQHTVPLSGLNAGTIYYAQPYVENQGDTAWGNLGVYATESNSSGFIRSYFNRPVNTTVAVNVAATYLNNTFNDTIKAYIDQAQNTVDLAIYNTNDQTIVQAVNAAKNRGVQVRYIAESSTANMGLTSLDGSIPVLYANETGIMHNKFIIIDAHSATNAHVITGSTNLTPNNLFDDANNLVIIQDESLAKAFEMEFNEMWGSTGASPNAATSAFGASKLNNTPHAFKVGGHEVGLYFSPSDGVTSQIETALRSTDNYLSFAVMAFTRNDLGEAIIDVNNSFGTIVQGLIEDSNGSGSEYDPLVAAGVLVRSTQSFPDIMHHKYAVVDMPSGTDPLVVTGSHNWSTSAETVNDENTLIIHSADVADVFYQDFRARFDELNIGIEEWNATPVQLYPNPTAGAANFTGVFQAGRYDLSVMDVTGRPVWSTQFNLSMDASILETNLEVLPAGVYTLLLTGEKQRNTFSIIVQ